MNLLAILAIKKLAKENNEYFQSLLNLCEEESMEFFNENSEIRKFMLKIKNQKINWFNEIFFEEIEKFNDNFLNKTIKGCVYLDKFKKYYVFVNYLIESCLIYNLKYDFNFEQNYKYFNQISFLDNNQLEKILLDKMIKLSILKQFHLKNALINE